MDTFDEKPTDTIPAKEQPEAKAPVKTTMNPFTKQSLPKNISTRHTPHNEVRKRTLAGASASQGRAEIKASAPKLSIPEEVLVIHMRASKDNVFYGDELLELILEHGLRFGAMDIFHCHAGEDGEGPILFSLSNMVKPGVFDLHTFDKFSTVGVSLFLSLPVETGSYLEAFEAMLATAKAIAKRLQGELKDENRSVLTGQTIEHYRERIRDFSRRQRLEKRKL
jgi:cell division protein ZipA